MAIKASSRDEVQGDGNTIAAYAQELTRSYYDGYGLSNPADIYTGKLRKTETRILGTADWLETEMFYDAFGRTQETRSNHQLKLGDPAADVVSFTYDFADNVLKQLREHKVGSEVTTILEEMHYDHAGRLTANYHEINGGSKVQISEFSPSPATASTGTAPAGR